MSAEIDNLEIKISADSSQAAADITALANSLSQLANSNIKSISDSLSGMSNAIKSIGEIKNTGELTKSIEKITSSIGKLNGVTSSDNIKNLAISLSSISNAKWNESAADNLRYFIDTLRILTDEDVYRLENLAEVLSSLKGAKGIDLSMFNDPTKSTAQTTGVEDVVEEYKYSINVVGAFATVLKGVGKTAMFVAKTGIKALGASMQALSVVSKGAFKGISAAVKGVFSPITSMAKKFKEASAGLGNFLASIKRMAMYRLIRTALKAITDGIRVGRENLYQYSQIAGTQFAKSMDTAATAAMYLKNSIGAATAPLTNYFVPIIDKVVDRVVELINKFNELTAVLTGADTWTKALKYPVQWQDAAEDANKSAKELKSTMLGFDELNVIEPSKNSGKSKLEDALDYSNMFEEVKTDLQAAVDFVDLTLPIKLALDKEGDNTLKSLVKTWKNIRELVESVAKSFKTVWMNGTGQRTLELILQLVQNISDTFGNIAKNIRIAWDEGEKGTHIIQNIWNSANNVLTVVKDIWGSFKNLANNIDWNPLFSTFESLTSTIEGITRPDSSLMKGFKALFTDGLEPIYKILVEEGLPAAVSLFESYLYGLNNVAQLIDFEGIVKGLGDIAALSFSNLSGLVSGLSAVISIASGKEVSEQDISNLEKAYERLVDFFGGQDSDYALIAKEIENNGLFGFGDELGQYIFDVLNGDNLDGLSWKKNFDEMGLDFTGGEEIGFFKDFKSNLETGWKDIVQWVDQNIIASIEDLFDFPETVGQNVGNWVKENVVDPIWNTLSAIINFPADLGEKVGEKVPELWEKLKGAINDAFGIKNNSSSKMKDLGKDVSNGMKNGISEPFKNASKWIQTNIFDPFIKGFKSIFKIGSPSKVMEEQGEFVSDGLLNGIKSKFSMSSVMEWVRSNLFEPFKNALNNVFGINKSGESDTGKSVGSSIISGIKSVFSGTDFSECGTEITEGIGSGITATFDSNVSGKVSEKRDLLKSFFRKDEFTESGKNIVSGVGDGINNNYDSSIGQWILQKVGWIQSAFDSGNFIGAGESIAAGIGEGFKNSNILEGLKQILIDNILNGDYQEGDMAAYVAAAKLANQTLKKPLLYPATYDTDIGNNVLSRSERRMASFGGNTITSGMAEAVYRAMMQATQQNSNGEMSIPNINLYIDRKELTTQIEAQQKSNGVKILGTVAYQ